MTDYYAILGVASDADKITIRQRYLFLAKAYHPDRFPEPATKAQAEEEMKKINEAYSILSVPEKREAYDRTKRSPSFVEVNEGGDDRTKQRFTEIGQYFDYLYKKWHHLLDEFPETPEIQQLLGDLFKGVGVLILGIYKDLDNPKSEKLTEEIQKSLIVLMGMNIALGAELETQAYPLKFRPVELKIYTSILFYEKITQLKDQAIGGNVFTPDEIENVFELLVDLSVKLCDESIKAGVAQIKKSQNVRNSETTRTQETHQSNVSSINNTGSHGCQNCHQSLPTEELTFSQNVGMIIFRFSKKVSGSMCASCAEKYFWEMTGISLLFGWWGVISAVTTPFTLIGNIWNYLKAWKLRGSVSNLFGIAIGWKFLILLIIGAGITLPLLSGGVVALALATSPTPTRYPTMIPRPTLRQVAPTSTVIRPTPTERINCTKWSQVTARDNGRSICVYGTVREAYFGGDNFFMRFSDESDAFRFLVTDNYYFEDVVGKCVSATGEVVMQGKMPYIIVGEHLYNCPWDVN